MHGITAVEQVISDMRSGIKYRMFLVTDTIVKKRNIIQEEAYI